MTDSEILTKVKADLRIDFSDLDEDIADNIKAAVADLGVAGVPDDLENNMLILRAVKLFCRWQYGFDGKPERYEKAYNGLKIALALDLGHGEA